MFVYVLLNLLSKSGKRDKMRGLQSILPLYRIEFNKFINTRALTLDPIKSQCMRFPTMWFVRPAKPQISLRICAV